MSASEDNDYDQYESDFIDDDGNDDEGSDFSDSRNKKKNKQLKNKKSLKKKKKQKRTADFFIEDQAVEDSEEESGEEDEELTAKQKESLARERKLLEKQFKPRAQGPSFMQYDEEEDLEEYFKNKPNAEDEGDDNELALLPTNGDPKLFAVKCKPNEERDACLQVMTKYFECLGSPAEFQIFSCTAINKTEGYIYIEAYSDKHVYMAIANIPNIFGSKITLVSLNDRTQIFEGDPTKNVEIKPGQWVRIKKGLYEGDLAQVEEVDDKKGRVYVKLAPRLSPENEEDENPDVDDEEAKKKKKYEHLTNSRKTNKIKPPQKLFQTNEYQGWDTQRDTINNRNYVIYKNQRFFDGLLFKWFPLKNVITQNINFTYEESKFFTIGENTDVDVLSTLIEQGSNKPAKFFKGDRVRVIKGDLQNLEAEILKINQTNILVRPVNTEYSEAVEIQPSDCVKAFNKGDYVRVVEGKNSGKEGFVLTVEENIATVMSDGLQNVIKVFVNDLVFCNESTRNIEVSTKKDKELEAEFVKFDLVKLNDRKTVGIVLGTATNGWKVLDNFGNVRTVTTYQIEQKLHTKPNTTRNDKGQIFRFNDSVRILQGKFKGQTGIAKHIYADLIFIYNPDVTQNMGVIIEKANNCFLLSSQRQGNARPAVGAGPKGKDTLIGQKCAIKSGPWKGYQGLVKDGNERTVRLELASTCRIIDVKRELVIPLSEVGKVTESTEGRNMEPKTPMINRFPQSPFFNMNSPGFENSPAWGGFESPAYDAHLH
jgi:transcription elongation factor SPT5